MKAIEKIKTGIVKLAAVIGVHSPEILVVTGVVGVVASGVIACVATTKVPEVAKENKKEIEAARNEMTSEGGDPALGKKMLTKAYINTGLRFAKLYAPSIILGSLSVAGLVGSNQILRKRNIGLAAAYTAVDKGFKEYRSRVVERFGEEVDKELKLGVKKVEVKKEIVDEKGKTKTVTETINVIDGDPSQFSEYSKIFDELNPNFEKDAELNKFFLVQTQSFMNDKLKANGFVFLNDVYETLGFPKTKAGQVVGWVYDTTDPNHIGNNYIDFGIFDVHKPGCSEFVNGYERAIVLDFNVDGPIVDKIKWTKF